MPYNVPGINGRLRLNGAVLANIYLGTVTNWNAPGIKALNPTMNLPDLKITPVYRSDGSGSTYAFTDYLSEVSPSGRAGWARTRASSFPVASAPRAAPACRACQIDGSARISSTTCVLDPEQVLFALIRCAGGFATPACAASPPLAAAEPGDQPRAAEDRRPARSAGRLRTDLDVHLRDRPDEVRRQGGDLRKFIYWTVTAGQRFGPPLYFVPLPATMKAFAYREIQKIQASTSSSRG